MSIQVYFDGACEPYNPRGHGSWGVSCVACGHAAHGYLGSGAGMSNNVAEYAAAAKALEHIAQHHADEPVELLGDSQLVVRQLEGEWNVNGGLYVGQYEKAAATLAQLPNVQLRWVLRAQNERADALSKQELEERGIRITVRR